MVQDSVAGSKMSESETEGRKWSKPIMEKRRRERINKSLDELKKLVLEAQNRDSSRYTKLEKADILEVTVKHLRGLRNRRKSVPATTTVVSQNLIPTGVNVGCCRCAPEVGHCIFPDHVVMETSERIRTQTMSHLVGISTNTQNRMYIDNSARGPSIMARDRNFTPGIPSPMSQGVVVQSRSCQPLHVNTAVQFIPICSSHLSNTNAFPGTLSQSNESYCFSNGDQFWRPF
ncbi:transcription factor HES-1-like [Actinia tenebrosa]|uniref:Transcription factor HES-1-like n=1 Tax=Actinia tenebrosa TaxID=6105 RepID=A0A6P8IDI8_ACTTE|nr:transcription factor HES-1-like [Actinia tenebrosa]